MRLSDLVAFAVLLEACCFFYVAHWFRSMFGHAQVSGLQMMLAGWPDMLYGILLLAAAAVYWRMARARPGLRILAIVGAVFGTYDFLSVQSAVSSYWGVFQGDIVAISAVSSLLLLVIGVLAATDHYVGKSQRRRLG
jgi:hypothetical protein